MILFHNSYLFIKSPSYQNRPVAVLRIPDPEENIRLDGLGENWYLRTGTRIFSDRGEIFRQGLLDPFISQSSQVAR